jgi:hypothetical protein
MKTENKEKLSALLNGHKAKEATFSTLRKENEDKRDQFLQSFEQLVKTDIEPLMQKFAEEMKSYGHYVRINYSPADRKQQGGKAANITMTLYLDSDTVKSGDYPYVAFYAHEHSQKASISVSTIRPNSGGTTSNADKDIELHQLTPEFIETKIMSGISEIFNNKC